MIQLYHVSKTYPGHDQPALSDVTLHIDPGEFVFLTGASGAGKSTLLELLFCAEIATRGQILVNGRNLNRIRRSEIPALRRTLGMVFQDFKLINTRTVLENVALALDVLGKRRSEVHKRAYSMLKHVGLAHKLHAMPPTLSGGEQQRVAIARALVNDPRLVLADEPTGNLDADLGIAIMELFEDMSSRGTTVLVATHDQNLVQRYRKRVVHLERGTVQEVRR